MTVRADGLPACVTIYEVGPRDGLQNEQAIVPVEVKAKVREYVDNGATCPILYPLGDVKMMIDTFAGGY